MKKLLVSLTLFGLGNLAYAKNHFADAQQLYRQGDFSAYFGLVQWIRTNKWSELENEERDHWLALELMALARHCRWSEIQRFKPEGAWSQKALDLISVKQEYKNFLSDPQAQRLKFSQQIIQAQSHWHLNSKQMAQLSTPQNLRVPVRSQCSK